MNRIFISVLFVLVFSWPALADEQFALVCDFEKTLYENGMSHKNEGKSTFIFEESENNLKLKSVSGLKSVVGFECDKIINYQNTEIDIFIECERKHGDLTFSDTITINRFSGDIQVISEVKRITEKIIYSGFCRKETKRF